ncbi:hypothetical protein DL768_003247 [Monosporascus sp. mg162]|nr:hypothetical protein DL768_003247 [Monosporascus sp. mg162]
MDTTGRLKAGPAQRNQDVSSFCLPVQPSTQLKLVRDTRDKSPLGTITQYRILYLVTYKDSTIPLNRSPKPEAKFPASTAEQESRHTSSETSQSVPRAAGTSTTPALATTKSEQQVEEEVRGEEFWRELAPYKDVSAKEFLSWRWSVKNVIERKEKLIPFLAAVLPKEVPCSGSAAKLQSRDGFMRDVLEGMKESSMHVRLMPYVLSRINWKDPANDPIFRQFIPLGSIMIRDHPMLKLDSLHERADSPVENVVHRYRDRALFLAVCICPAYCAFCTRSYGVGPDTELISKAADRFRLSNEKLDAAFTYFSTQEQLRDVVVSGGDAFYLEPHVLEMIGERLISLPNIKRFRFASRGLALSPHRFLDRDDKWTDALIRVSDKARKAGKHMALHTHFNHPNEISWVTEKASRRLHEAAVKVRNQTVLLRGVNDNVETMSTLLQKLADMVIEPYYLYQCDMVPKVEHLRTPLQTILDMEKQLRGSISGFCMPHFVVDLPGGGGKQLASTSSYDRESGISTFTAPALTRQGKAGKVYKYYDPVKPGGLVSEQGKNEVPTGKVLEAEGQC